VPDNQEQDRSCMPALADIGKYKRLSELFVLAMKVDPVITVAKNEATLNCLMEHGLTERMAEQVLDSAFEKFERGMVRGADQTLRDIRTFFRKREHGFILTQLQTILEEGTINEQSQEFFNLCCDYLYHEE
jgi:hypothetical protein